ncbi:hypothetical protein [Streptomyces sp. NPDC000656]|uniref:hypothetical protein n=1 Tax=unclassified Streptomyces TaxID=2593676 RepID=UPI0036C1CD23
MGASGWDYVAGYDGDVEAALATLQAGVFQEEYGDDARYRILEDLYGDEEFMGTEGTHTILDIDRVVATDAPPTRFDPADYGTLRPLALDRVMHHLGPHRVRTGVQRRRDLSERFGPWKTVYERHI